MSETGEKELRHSGHFAQTAIYLGKLFRMFAFQNDWKVLPMSAVIAALVGTVLGKALFLQMEPTLMGTFALCCICIWNGCFNSIQSVCRERPIVKREHRSGLHISAYITAHMIYQAFICFCQTWITLFVCGKVGVTFPRVSFITGEVLVDFGITVFLITYAADMLSLMISSFVRSTTTAMTVMPFLLIFQLVFSGGFFSLDATAQKITPFTISRWGLTALCAEGNFNELPSATAWNALVKLKGIEYQGAKPLEEALIYMEENGMKDAFMAQCGKLSQLPQYASEPENIVKCWGYLLLHIIFYVCVALICLEFIDRDQR